MTVFEIERFATADGPGIRTVVFLKGCNLRCSWCQNPESQAAEPQVMYYPDKCVACGKCVEACPVDAVIVDPKLGYVTDHSCCTLCAACVDACFYGARKIVGTAYSSEELVETIRRDQSYYRDSGGGVTFSGGEPLLQIDGLVEAATALRREGIHVAVETAGNVPWKVWERLLAVVDLVYFDLKAYDRDLHTKVTGVANDRIKENIARVSKRGTPIVVRIPVVPGINNGNDEIAAMFGFLRERTSVRDVELLPFHRLGLTKYAGLGMPYELDGIESLTEEACRPFAELGLSYGLNIRVGARFR